MAKSTAQTPVRSTTDQLRELANAYEAVFGVEGHRSLAQQKVWAHQADFCYARKAVFVLNGKGELQALRAAWADGRRSWWRNVLDQLDFARAVVEKPKTIRR